MRIFSNEFVWFIWNFVLFEQKPNSNYEYTQLFKFLFCGNIIIKVLHYANNNRKMEEKNYILVIIVREWKKNV